MLDELARTLRKLAREPRFCGVVIVTLALAGGGGAALFSLFDAVVRRPLPVRDADRLVAIFPANGEALFGIPMATMQAFEDGQPSLESVCGVSQGSALTIDVKTVTSLRPIEAVTGECARVLGLTPAIGRLIGPADAPVSGASAHVVAISHRLWQREFGGTSDILGQTLRVEGRPLTVIGVLPETYRGLNADEAPDVSLPLATMWELRGGRVLALHMVGRLRSGVTLDDARAPLRSAWAAAWMATHAGAPDSAPNRGGRPENLRVDPLDRGFSPLRARFAQPLTMAAWLAALLIVLAAINASALLLLRLVSREQQLAVQIALGASRARLAAGVLIEGLALSSLAAAAALPIAWWASQLVASVAWTGSRPLTMTVTPTAPTLAVVAAAGIASGLIISLAPVLAVWFRALDLKGSSNRGVFGSSSVSRRALVVGQVAVSFGLLFCAGLFVTNLTRLQGTSLGYPAENLLWTRLEQVFGAPRAYDLDTYARTIVDRASELPGVESVALAVGFPTTDLRMVTALFPIERGGDEAGRANVRGMMDRVSAGFFRTAGIPLLAGREFGWNDTTNAPPVVVITQPLADRLFPNQDAVGQQLRVPGRKPSDLTIVGVAADFSPGDPRIKQIGRIYVPLTQEPGAGAFPVVLMRTRGGASPTVADLRAVVGPAGRHQVSFVRTVDEQVNRLLTQERLLSGLALAFAGLGTLVCALGLYALLAHGVTRRVREIGVRLAIGASRGSIRTLVLREGLSLVLLGVAAGAPLAAAGGYLSRSLLFEMSPLDGWAAAAAVAIVILAGLGGALAPSIRAARTEPAVAMRSE